MTSEEAFNEWWAMIIYVPTAKASFIAGHASRDAEVSELKRQRDILAEACDFALAFQDPDGEVGPKLIAALADIESKGGKEEHS